MSENEAEQPLPGVMPGRTPENAPQDADFAPAPLAKALLRAGRTGTWLMSPPMPTARR
jgi:hypothetical protein